MKYSAIEPQRAASLDYLVESEPYRRLAEAIRQNNTPLAGAIVSEQIAATAGDERFLWLGLQLSLRLRHAKTPREKLGHWPAIVELALEAGKSPDRQKIAVGNAFGVLLESERVTELAQFCLRHRPGYALFRRDAWAHHNNRGLLHSLCGRWERAYRAYTLSLKAFRELPEAQLSAMLGYLVVLFAERSMCACRLGWLDVAEADLRKASAAQDKRTGEPFWVNCMAEAELALQLGEHGQALSMLQTADMRLNSSGTTRSPRAHIRMDLLAARIARAQGNIVSFHHFATRALAVATEHDLQLSQAEVRRVLAGAPA